MRVGRGIVDVTRTAKVRLVVANTTRVPIQVRAGDALAYARPVHPDEFDIVDCDVGATSPMVGGSATVHSARAAPDDTQTAPGPDPQSVSRPEGFENPFFSRPTARPAESRDCVRSTPHVEGTLGTVTHDANPSAQEVEDMLRSLPPETQDVLRAAGAVRSTEHMPAHLKEVKLGENLNSVQSAVARTLITAYADVFNSSTQVPTRTAQFRAHIETGSARPISSAPYRVSPAERKVIDKEIDTMLRAGVVRPSRSPWGAPVVLVPKKDGSIRFCVDYRKLNRVTKVETYPLPRIDEALRAFQGATCFSVMDMQSGYWQVPLSDESIPKTAFVTHKGLYEYVVLPFGPVNAPGHFQRMMDEVIGGLKWTSVLVYIDDLIVFSPSVEQHVTDLKVVFDRLRAAGLTLKPKKCELFAPSVKYLGQVVSAQGIAPDPEKIRAIRDMPLPTSKSEVKAFIGLAGYYRRFVKNFSGVVEPLLRLTRDDTAFTWGPFESEATSAVKDALCTAPVLLAHPDFAQPFTLMTDASGVGIGAVLSQTDPHTGMERVVEYASRSLTRAERAWSATEQEALAVKWHAKSCARMYTVPASQSSQTTERFSGSLRNKRPIRSCSAGHCNSVSTTSKSFTGQAG